MATRKAISTISYNSIPFLREKLDSWIASHKIQAYQYIQHAPEESEKKAHIHLRIEPNISLDPMALSDDLREIDMLHPDLPPLGCRPWRPSKEEDWILYACHYPGYLKMKYAEGCADGKIEYSYKSICANSDYDIESMWIRALQALEHIAPSIAHAIVDGRLSPIEAIYRGNQPATVNSIYRAVMATEYPQLCAAHAELQRELNRTRDEYAELQRELDRVRGELNRVYESQRASDEYAATKYAEVQRELHIAHYQYNVVADFLHDLGYDIIFDEDGSPRISRMISDDDYPDDSDIVLRY